MNSLSRAERAILFFGLAAATSLLLLGCGGAASGTGFAGSIDTLETGQILVSNPEAGIWGEETDPWRVVEDVRIGSMDGDGPEVFGRISDFEIDPAGRFYVVDGQAQELRIFDTDGSHVRTIGRKGGGPGEFEQVIGMDWAPDGNLWVVDPGNSRISVFDTAGTYLDNHLTLGGFVIMPWPGGFDDRGRFYNYGIDPNAESGFGMVLVRFDEELEPLDSLPIPRWDGPENFFEASTEGGGRMRTTVPFSPGLTGYFVRHTDYYWFARTGEYRLFQRTLDGDTLRIIEKAFDPIPVTGDDVEAAMERLEWFTSQGGQVDRGRFPSHKPALNSFFVDDAGYVWVSPVTDDEDDRGRVFDIFDDVGRYLGRLDLPLVILTYPRPIVRGNVMVAVTQDELEVSYLIRARLVGPSAEERGRAVELGADG